MSSDFDSFDDIEDVRLGNALRRVAGSVPDAGAAFGSFQRRVRVARVRRISVAVGSGAAVIALGVGAFALTGRGPASITPADPGITLDSVVDTTTPDTTAVSTPDTSGTPSGTSGAGTGKPSGDDSDTSEAGTPSGGSSGDSGSGKTTTTEADDGQESEHEGSSTTVRSTTSTSSSTVPSASKRCTSAYGSFTAVHAGGVTVHDVAPATGYSTKQVEEEDSSAKVVFRSGETEVGLEALWNGSGFSCRINN